jgi:hypothetical protein
MASHTERSGAHPTIDLQRNAGDPAAVTDAPAARASGGAKGSRRASVRVSRPARRDTGPRRRRPPAARGAPPARWPRSGRVEAGRTGWRGQARQGAVSARPRAGRCRGRACRPGGSGSSRPGLERGVGHGDHPGPRAGRAARPPPSHRRRRRAGPSSRSLCLPGRSGRPASDVTSGQVSPGGYGERCTGHRRERDGNRPCSLGDLCQRWRWCQQLP